MKIRGLEQFRMVVALGMAVVCVVAALRMDVLGGGPHTSAVSVRALMVLFGVGWLVQARWIGRQLE